MREFLLEGGPMLWVILGMGLVAFAAFVERGFHLHRARIVPDDFMKGIVNILKRHHIDEALAICEETPGPVARIVKTAILHKDSGRKDLEAAITETGLTEISRLEARVGIISTVAQVAPLCGLLGTILGLMTLLGEMAPSFWQPGSVAVGLRTALVTTAAGLTVAILSHLSHNLVVAKIEALVADMARSTTEIIGPIMDSK